MTKNHLNYILINYEQIEGKRSKERCEMKGSSNSILSISNYYNYYFEISFFDDHMPQFHCTTKKLLIFLIHIKNTKKKGGKLILHLLRYNF